MSVTFTDWEGKTRVDVHMLFESAAELEKVLKQYRAGEGLKQTLRRLEELLAKSLSARKN
jgi:broad specificity phosphatase PhoE